MNNKNTKLKPRNITKLFLGIIPILILALTFSCENELSSIGSELLPDSDKISFNYDTTLSFNCFLTQEEDYVTMMQDFPHLGYQNDPYFGTVEARIGTNYILTNLNINFSDTAGTFYSVADSSVLYLVMDSTTLPYGDRDYETGFSVYKLKKPFENDIHYSNTPIDDYIDIDDPISLDSRYVSDTIIVRLRDDFSDFLIPPADSIWFYRSEEKFLEKYYGLAIIPNETDNLGELLKIDLYHQESKIILHYHRDSSDGTPMDTSEYKYRFYSGNGRNFNYNEIIHNHEEGIISDYLNNDSLVTDDYIFVQGLGGMSSKLIFNNYQNFIDDSLYSILRAEMFIPIFKDANFELLYPPEQLYFLSLDSDSNLYQIDDYSKGNFFDGYYDDNKNGYSFDVSQHLASLLNEENTDSILYLRHIDIASDPYRAILNANEVKLKITYTKH